MARRLLGICAIFLGLVGCGSAAEPSGETVGETEEALKPACAPATTVLGIDIASYQHPGGAGIDWNAVAASRRFVIIKASEGTGYTNDYYPDDSTQARAHGMLVGAYHFLRYTSSGAAQAQNFLAAIGGNVPGGDFPAMLDVENTSDGASPEQRVQIMKEWLDTVEAASGRKPMIYSGSWYWGPYMGSPGGYGGVYPMVWAAYNDCPKIPDDFPGIAILQYLGGDGSTPGIPAPCDQDMFYGSESELMALVNRPPGGWLDGADCDSLSGWAQDPDAPTTPIDVHIYAGGPAGSGAPGKAFHADTHRDDLCAVIGSCEHGFKAGPPLSFFDGQPHEMHAYGIDSGGGNNAELSGSPKSMTCTATPPTGARRHVTDPASFAAWKFDEFWQTLPIGDAEIQKLPKAGDLPAAPELVIADDGSPEVWLVDGTARRHVPDPAAMAAWALDWGAIATKPAAEVHALTEGTPWRARPVLLHETDGTIWVVDDAIADTTPGGGGGTGSGGTGSGGAHASGGKSSGGSSQINPSKKLTDSDEGGCGCSVPAERGSRVPAVFALALLAFAFRRRRN